LSCLDENALLIRALRPNSWRVIKFNVMRVINAKYYKYLAQHSVYLDSHKTDLISKLKSSYIESTLNTKVKLQNFVTCLELIDCFEYLTNA
jgi:hypothetical protein